MMTTCLGFVEELWWGEKYLFMDFCYGWVCLPPTVCLWHLKHANTVLNTLTLATFTIKVLYVDY